MLFCGATGREVANMPIPNIGPEHPDSGDPDAAEAPRRRNPTPVLRDEPHTDDVVAASTRASTVTHRFGGVRRTLSRPEARPVDPAPPGEGDEPDARQ